MEVLPRHCQPAAVHASRAGVREHQRPVWSQAPDGYQLRGAHSLARPELAGGFGSVLSNVAADYGQLSLRPSGGQAHVLRMLL